MYRARADTLPREAWAEFERECAAWGPWVPGSVRRVSGFEFYFRDSPGAEAGFDRALEKWKFFTEACVAGFGREGLGCWSACCRACLSGPRLRTGCAD